MKIAHNLLAINSCIQFNRNVKIKSKSVEKLSSGFRVNRSADDAAGLSISEKMRNQIRNLNQALDNIEDGIAFVHTADGALDEVQKMVHRIAELSVQAANDVYDEDDRKSINNEVQELKAQIHDIFRETSFNGKKIFRVSYVPDISTHPNDFQVFNSADGEYGGITVNHLRYSWEELENKIKDNPENNVTSLFKDDGKTFVGGRYTFYDYTGEKITFDTKKDTQAPDIYRLYEWEAKNDGIYINNVLATTWYDLGITSGSEIKERYNFTFHGMEIAFNTEEGDNCLKDVMDGINSVDFNAQVTWSGVNAGIFNNPAVEVVKYQDQYIDIYDSWKAHTTDLKLKATSSGISLINIEKNAQNLLVEYTLSSMKWEEFKDINSIYDKFPIVDWGLGVDNMNQDDITLDYDAVYRFKDATTGFYFNFKLSDEASLEEVTKGLSIDLVENYNAPIKVTYSNTAGSHFKASSFSNPTIAYQTQLKTGKSFDNWKLTEFNTGFDMKFNTNTNKYDVTFSLHDNRGDVVSKRKTSIARDTFRGNVINGRTTRIYLSGYEGDSGLTSLSFDFKTDRFAMTADQINEAATQAERARLLCEETLKQTEKNIYINQGHTEDEFNIYWQTRKNDNDIVSEKQQAYDSEYLRNELRFMDLYVEEAVKFVSDIDVNISQSAQPQLKFNMTPNTNVSQHTEFGTVLNPPERYMHIQSGANQYEHTKIIWKGLNLSAIGMGDANTSTRELAVGTIGATYTATKILSGVRSMFGAFENRLMYEYNNNQNYKENLEKSESIIRDTDMAKESMKLAKQNILEQIGQAMFVQANKSAQAVLNLLGV